MTFNAKLVCFFCGPGTHEYHDFSALGQHVREAHADIAEAARQLSFNLAANSNQLGENENMGTIADMKKEKGVGGPPMLHGSDVPRSVSTFKVKCKELREAPKTFNSLAIMDIDPVYDCEAIAINVTNLRALAELAHEDPDTGDFDRIAKWAKGKTLTVYVIVTNNPKTHKQVRSLSFGTPE